MLANFERLGRGPFSENLYLVTDNKGTISRFQVGCTQSPWYQRFSQGVQVRMDTDVRPNLGVSSDLWHALLNKCRTKSDESEIEEMLRMKNEVNHQSIRKRLVQYYCTRTYNKIHLYFNNTGIRYGRMHNRKHQKNKTQIRSSNATKQ